ncbi:MAG: cupin domain-containing protein [Endomicrobia bacterium]|nr:cupin domain-containing protein [Endomicrobiia bacterium]
MKEIKISQPTKEELEKLKITSWSAWECETSKFEWEYTEDEICYILKGKVIVETNDGKKYEIKKGDLVIFPKRLKCIWDVKEPIRKRYNLL